MADTVRLKGTYGKPIATAAGQKIPLTRSQLERVGKTILAAIRAEIRKDTAKAAGLRRRGEPVPIPRTAKFAKSFKFRISGESTLEFTSDWPTAQGHMSETKSLDPENTRAGPAKEFKMTWLTRDKVPFARIVRADGEVIVRMTPDINKGGQYWVHPGFKKYTFLERGFKKGREKAIREMTEEIVRGLLSKYDLLGG